MAFIVRRFVPRCVRRESQLRIAGLELEHIMMQGASIRMGWRSSSGGEGDLETRIDQQPLPADPRLSDSVAAARAMRGSELCATDGGVRLQFAGPLECLLVESGRTGILLGQFRQPEPGFLQTERGSGDRGGARQDYGPEDRVSNGAVMERG